MIEKNHPLLTQPNRTFVAMSDIHENFYDHNEVIYNPALPYDERLQLLKQKMKKCFHKRISPKLAMQIADIVYDMDKAIKLIRTCFQ